MPRASLDIGSNSILLLVVDDHGRVIHDSARVVGLGRGLGDRGLLRSDRVEAALEVLQGYVGIAGGLGVQPAAIQAVATSALRRALNGETFLARVRALTGVTVRIIAGEQEAELTATGALTGLALPRGPVLVADVGGGSTELILVRADLQLPGPPAITWRRSFEVGTVRIREAWLAQEPVRSPHVARAREAIAQVFAGQRPDPLPRAVVAVAGTPTSLSAAELGQRSFDGNALHGSVLELFTLRRWIDRLLHADPEQRRALLPASPERADTMLAGILILEQVLLLVQRTNLLVSNRGVRFAVL